MQVLVVPYLYFRDFAQSSGVLHQAQIGKALAEAGVGVTALVPKKEDGWVYEAGEYFGGHANLCTYEVGMAKDQHMWSGFWTEEMYRVLSPMRSPLVFDAVVNMIPPCAAGMKRLLAEIGFSRLSVPVIDVFDTVTVPSEANIRGGNLASHTETLMRAEAFSASVAEATVVTTFNEHRSLRANIRRVLSPSLACEALERTRYLPKPLALPEPVPRRPPAEGDPWLVFMGRSFGRDFESGGRNGEQVASVVKAIALLRTMGRDVRLLLCTRSPLDAWAKALLAELGDGLEIVHNRPRAEVLQHMRRAHICVDLRDYDALYMAALEQQASGAPTLTKASRWAEGEVSSSVKVESHRPGDIMAGLAAIMDAYDMAAPEAFEAAGNAVKRHDPKAFGFDFARLIADTIPDFDPRAYKTLFPFFEAAASEGLFEGVSFDRALKAVLAKTRSGSFGRFPKIWALKMMRGVGCTDRLQGGIGHPELHVVRDE